MRLTWDGNEFGPDIAMPVGTTVIGVAGFELFRLADLKAERIDGEPVLTGITIEPLPGATVGITAELLAGLPTRNIAALVLASAEGGDVWKIARLLSDVPMQRPRGGSDDFSWEVVNTVRAARLHAENSVEAVADRWHISVDRANQYVREARQRLGSDVLPDGRSERHQRPEERQRPVQPPTPVASAEHRLEHQRARSRRVHPTTPKESA